MVLIFFFIEVDRFCGSYMTNAKHPQTNIIIGIKAFYEQ